jgi:hypothetical protein
MPANNTINPSENLSLQVGQFHRPDIYRHGAFAKILPVSFGRDTIPSLTIELSEHVVSLYQAGGLLA